jgi:hypothetical protein
MKALTRRQRIQRAIAPAPIPEGFLPLLRESVHSNQQFRAEAFTLAARMDTLEQVTLPHLERLERAIPEQMRRFALSMQETLTREYHRFARARRRITVTARHITEIAETLPLLRTKRARWRWLAGR